MSGPDQEKIQQFGLKLNARASLDTISAIPIKKRRFIFSSSPSPPSETQSSQTVDCGTTQDKSFSLVQVPSLETSDIACLTASPDEGSSLESGFKILVNGDRSESPKHHERIEHGSNETLQSTTSIIVDGENGLKDCTVSDDKLVYLKGIEQPSASVTGHVDVAIDEEILDAKNSSSQTSAAQLSENTELQCNETFEKVNISETHSIRQAQFELQDPSSRKETSVHDLQLKCFKFGANTDFAQSSLDRSNWDLNTTMDTWEESMNESALNHERDGHNRSGFGSLFSRGRQPNLIRATATNKKPNASPPMIGEPKSLSTDHFSSLCTSPKSGGVCHNSESEACLDLHLKPSFISESYFTYGTPFTLGNVDSLKDTQFLSLSTRSSSSSADAEFSLCGAVKPEPYHGCLQLGEKKTEIAESEAFVLKPVKSEPCEIGEASRITISGAANSASDAARNLGTICGVVNSASDAAIKLEPVEDKSQDFVAAKETGLSHISADDHSLLQSAKTPLEAAGTCFMASITKSDSFIKDVIMHEPGKYPHLHKCEVDGMADIVQNEVLSNDKIGHRTMLCAASISQSEKGIICESKSLDMKPLVGEGRELISIKQASNEGSERTDFFIKCQIEDQIMNLVSEACEQRHMAEDSVCESFNSGILVERVVDEKAEIDSRMSLSETDSKTATVIEKYADCDVVEVNQAMTKSICMIEEQGDNESKTCSPHGLDVLMRPVDEKGGIDDHGATVDSHLRVEIKRDEGTHLRGIVDVPVTMLSSHELVKHTILGSSERSNDPGTVECANNNDPTTAADLQESSSVTGDSNRMKANKIIRKTSRDVLKKDKVSERKTKSDRDPTLRVENKADSSGLMENAGGCAKSSVSLSAGEAIKDALDRVHTGRIINLNSASSQRKKPIHERPLLSRVKSEDPADKLLKREKPLSRRSRDENPSEKSHKTENGKRRGLACGNHGSGSTHTTVRGGSDYTHLRFRDKQRPNQFSDRNCDPNYVREQINDHNDFRYSRANDSAAVSVASGLDASVPCAGRMSRKVTNERQSRTYIACRRHSPGGPEQMPVMRPHTNEVNPSRCVQRNAHDLVYVSQEKMNRPVPGELLNPLRPHRHAQFERTDRIAAHHERLSPSPVRRRRGPTQLTPPLCSPRSQTMSPSHWSPRSASEGFNEQPEMVQCRTGTPIIMQESMRSTRQHYAEEILARRRGSVYGARLPDGMMEVISSREHDFPRSGREFPRKIQRLDMNDPRRVPGEYYRAPFGHSQIHELAVDGECAAVGRRCNEVHAPARYRQHCLAGDDVEDFSFHGEEGPPRSYRYHSDGNHGFHEDGNSREFEGRFKHRLGNTSRRYRHVEEQQHHEDGFSHPEGQGWNDSGFNNIRPRRRRY